MACTCHRCWIARLYASTGLVLPVAFTNLFVGSHSNNVATEIDDGNDTTDIDDEPYPPTVDLSWLDDAPDLENDLPSDGYGLLDLALPKPARRKRALTPPWFLGVKDDADDAAGKRRRIPTRRMNL